MFGTILGLAGGVGSGGTSQTPGSGGGGYGNSSANAQSSAEGGDTSLGPIYGGGVDLGPNVVFDPVSISERVHLTGSDQINAPLSAIAGIPVAWIMVAAVIGLIAFVALRR